MENIEVYTKDTLNDGEYRISDIVLNDVNTNIDYLYHIMLILRIKGIPDAVVENSYFAYDFSFTFGG